MKLVTILGARPQFIKASAVSRAIAFFNRNVSDGIDEVLVHTGQHFDKNMSDIFFNELELSEPKYNLGISQASHGDMTGKMMIAIEKTLKQESPDMVMVYGDTNSTLAGAMAAVKMDIPVTHVEAGLRSFNRRMPEEINRVVTDHVSSLLFCPTQIAVDNLKREGIDSNIHLVGDVMYDVTLLYQQKAREKISLSRWGVTDGNYVLVTIHRAENTDEPDRFNNIIDALKEISRECPVLFPVHPRTKKLLQQDKKLMDLDNIIIAEPVSFLEMLRLESSAKAIFTDSGGVQKEAYFQGKPCFTLRDETEWVETVEAGVNKLCGTNIHAILDAWHNLTVSSSAFKKNLYGDGASASIIVDEMYQFLN